jgi:hypothetical protein
MSPRNSSGYRPSGIAVISASMTSLRVGAHLTRDLAMVNGLPPPTLNTRSAASALPARGGSLRDVMTLTNHAAASISLMSGGWLIRKAGGEDREHARDKDSRAPDECRRC